MGPSEGAMEQVKRDAIRSTLRHLRNEIEDNGYEPAVDLDEVEAQLLGENGGAPSAKATKARKAKVEVPAEVPAESEATE